MTRTTKKTVVGVSLSEAQQAANTYSSVSASLGKLEAQLNEKLQQVREQYEFKITDLREQLAQPVDLLEAYAKENRGEWEGKSLELSNCVIGFRTNPPSVAKKRGITCAVLRPVFLKMAMMPRRMLLAFSPPGYCQVLALGGGGVAAAMLSSLRVSSCRATLSRALRLSVAPLVKLSTACSLVRCGCLRSTVKNRAYLFFILRIFFKKPSLSGELCEMRLLTLYNFRL